MGPSQIGNVLKSRFTRIANRGLGSGMTIAELKGPILPKMERPRSLSKLIANEKVAAVFYQRLVETVLPLTKAAAAGLRPAYSNPFEGRHTRRGYGQRGQYVVPHSDPYKPSELSSKDPSLVGLKERARARRLFREQERKRQLAIGRRMMGKAIGGGAVGAGAGGVLGGLLGLPFGPVGVAGGATLGATAGGTAGGLYHGGGDLLSGQFLQDIGIPPGIIGGKK